MKMTDTDVTMAAAESRPTKKPTKVKKIRSKPTHPRTADMVNAAIKSLKERSGSSLQAIKKYVTATYKIDAEKQAPFIKKYIKAAVESGGLVQTKGKGAAGSFKLSVHGETTKRTKAKTPSKASAKAVKSPKRTPVKKLVKKVVKKTEVKKVTAKPAEKKKAVRSPAAKLPKVRSAVKVKPVARVVKKVQKKAPAKAKVVKKVKKVTKKK
ncbi:histone H1-like [Microplitis mediator]|uniref:histone H1-like n=1 Tax=Microplitis mediator TaxID=375433 RepID=UPI00255767BC|nr:histone H1-like [Microplitis mediator]